jgi:hypothetical protein
VLPEVELQVEEEEAPEVVEEEDVIKIYKNNY